MYELLLIPIVRRSIYTSQPPRAGTTTAKHDVFVAVYITVLLNVLSLDLIVVHNIDQHHHCMHL